MYSLKNTFTNIFINIKKKKGFFFFVRQSVITGDNSYHIIV